MLIVRKDRIDLTSDAGTAKVEFYQIPETDVYLMDTPGFDDTKLSDAQVLETIAEALVDAFNDEADIQGALYVHPVTEAKMRGSGRKNLIMFNEVLGTEEMSHCRLVTTKWSLQAEDVSKDRERELCEKEEFWKPLIDAGAKTVRFNDSQQSALEIIAPLVQGDAFEPLLVDEMVRKNKTLSQTRAGEMVNDDIEEATKAHKAEIADLLAKEAEFREKNKVEFANLLQAEREKLQGDIDQLKEDKKILSTSMATRESGNFGRWVAEQAIETATTVLKGGVMITAMVLLYGLTGGEAYSGSNARRRHPRRRR